MQKNPRKGKAEQGPEAFNVPRSCGDRRSSARPCKLPATLVVTRWATLNVSSSTRQLVQWRLGWSRPCRAAWLIRSSRRRLRGANGPCSFRVDALLKARSLLSIARTVSGPAGDLSPVATRPTALHWTRTSPRLQTPLRSDDQQPCTGLEPLPDSERTELWRSPPRLRTGFSASQPGLLSGSGVVFGVSPSTLHPRLAPPLLSF